MDFSIRTVLIIDDEIDMRDITKDLIRQTIPGIKIFEAPNGAEGFRLVKVEKIDLVITDLAMPRMNGKTFIASLGGLPPELRPKTCFVISGHIEEEQTVS